MPKFTFICQHEADEFSGFRENRVTFEAETYEDVLAEVTEFLRGSGYYFKGSVDIVDYEQILADEAAEQERSKWNFAPLEEALGRMAKSGAGRTCCNNTCE